MTAEPLVELSDADKALVTKTLLVLTTPDSDTVWGVMAGLMAYVARPGRRLLAVEERLQHLLQVAPTPMDEVGIACSLAKLLRRSGLVDDARAVLRGNKTCSAFAHLQKQVRKTSWADCLYEQKVLREFIALETLMSST